MPVDVAAELRRLNQTPVPDLKARYAEVFGEATRSNNRDYLVKRIIWRLQAREEGDLSARARRGAEELADDADLRTRAPKAEPHANGLPLVASIRVPRMSPAPTPGMVLTREYKGRLIAARVLPKGYEYEGKVYRSLTAIANEVTGGHWNGRLFFRLGRGQKAEPQETTA
ncbi:MAG: DUF2924 domain-containing protein [Deltaproteobacteria bacterium]|nr:DUF2924 domain-containing protein [Deltaproteobacteria bacterium]